MQTLLYAEHYLLTHDVLPIAAKELTVGSFVFGPEQKLVKVTRSQVTPKQVLQKLQLKWALA